MTPKAPCSDVTFYFSILACFCFPDGHTYRWTDGRTPCVKLKTTYRPAYRIPADFFSGHDSWFITSGSSHDDIEYPVQFGSDQSGWPKFALIQ